MKDIFNIFKRKPKIINMEAAPTLTESEIKAKSKLSEEFALKVIELYRDYLKQSGMFSENELDDAIALSQWQKFISSGNPILDQLLYQVSSATGILKRLTGQMNEAIRQAYDFEEIPIIMRCFLQRSKIWQRRINEDLTTKNIQI